MKKKIFAKIDFDKKPLQPIQCACTNLKMAARAIGRAYDEALAPIGINITQYAILINVLRYQPISQMKLARHLDLERTTLYRAVKILAGKKYLAVRGVGDGKTKVLTLTSSGEAVARSAKKKWEGLHEAFIGEFGGKQWSEFLKKIGKVREIFG